MIEICNLTFGYPGHPPVFKDFTWGLTGDGCRQWAVLGPSGCGKSTLLLLLAGLLRPQAGEIIIKGQTIARPRPNTGLILQEYGLLPWATVRENVILGLRIRQFYGPDGRHVPAEKKKSTAKAWKKSIAMEQVNYWLDRLGIADLADKYPGQISGGQRQRTAIARTLVLKPDLLLMDEPFSALDVPTRESLQLLTLELCAEAGLTIILVTHAIEEAAFMGQNILLLDQPPICQVEVMPNPHTMTANYRQSTEYQQIVTTLRKRLQKSL